MLAVPTGVRHRGGSQAAGVTVLRRREGAGSSARATPRETHRADRDGRAPALVVAVDRARRPRARRRPERDTRTARQRDGARPGRTYLRSWGIRSWGACRDWRRSCGGPSSFATSSPSPPPAPGGFWQSIVAVPGLLTPGA